MYTYIYTVALMKKKKMKGVNHEFFFILNFILLQMPDMNLILIYLYVLYLFVTRFFSRYYQGDKQRTVDA